MCRLVAYTGSETALEHIVIAPPHSLLEQSHSATEAKLAVNGDGFGISWYGLDRKPGLYRDILPAWSDGNLLNLCRMIRSRLFLAHVRASTAGETSRVNCHPFTHENWSFMHNGQIAEFAKLRRKLETRLPDHLYNIRRGTTDSELLFLLLLACGLESDPELACTRVISLLAELKGEHSQPNRLTCVFSNGVDLFAFRHSCDNKSPTLYYSNAVGHQAAILASEPLGIDNCTWNAVPENSFIRIRGDGCLSELSLAA